MYKIDMTKTKYVRSILHHNGKEWMVLEPPLWVERMLRDAHGDREDMPDQWVLSVIADLLDRIIEQNITEINDALDFVHPDVDSAKLLEWMTKWPHAIRYIDEVLVTSDIHWCGIIEIVSLGQLYCKEQIAAAVLRRLVTLA